MEWLYRAGWVLSVLLAIAGIVLYLVVESGWTWWVGMAMAGLPALMALWRLERKGDPLQDDYYDAGDSGPWAAP